MTPEQRALYLDLLQLDPEPPSPAALARLVTAHHARFPFENLSKLVRAARGRPPGIPTLDEFLAASARDGTGATCYRLNSALGGLLRALGYEVRLAGADMQRPDLHVVTIVALDGRDHLVDVGYGAPLLAPLPLDADRSLPVPHGPDAFVLHPFDPAMGRHRLDHLQSGEVVHGYALNPAPRRLDEFAAVIADSFRPDAKFMNMVFCLRHTPGRSVELRDFAVDVTELGVRRRLELAGRAELQAFLVDECGLAPAVAAEACAALAARGHAAFA